MRRFGVVSAAEIPDSAVAVWMPLTEAATGDVWAEAAECSADDIDLIVEAATVAFREQWRPLDGTQRGRLIRRWADLVEQHGPELAELDSRDTGNLRTEALGDVASAVNWLGYYAGMADKIEGRSLPAAPGRVGYTVREPFGVVAGINSYNANVTQCAWKGAPALAAGNCVILKAPEVAPSSSIRMGELALEAGIPAGVVNVVTGRGSVTGTALAEHPGIGRLVFTGSATTAERITMSSASSLKALGFELGGKNAVIVLPDVDADLFVPSILHSNFVKAGQSCASGSRVYVHADRYDELADRLAKAAQAIKVGLPSDPSSQMGSLVTQAHRDRVAEMVARGVSQGAQIIAGGERAGGPLEAGAFYQPTVAVGLQDDNTLVQDELFGPVLGLMRYEDLDEAIVRANALDVGLTAQIWGDSASAIHHAARELDAGTIWVNTYRSVHWTAPYGGFKRSGYGRENGFEALDLYTQTKTVMWDLTTDRQLPYQA